MPWRIASTLEELRLGGGTLLERTPMDYLISQGYMVVYREADGEVTRFLLRRVYDGAEKRWKEAVLACDRIALGGGYAQSFRGEGQ
jgi:hypothetical protein